MSTKIAAAWPFAIGRGRRVGYRLIAAPSWLADSADRSVLLDGLVSPQQLEVPQTIALRTASGHHLTVVYQARRVRRDEVALDSVESSEAFLDGHGRPIEVLLGFIVADADVSDLQAIDLERSIAVGMDAYRSFLADETSVGLPVVAAPFSPASALAPLAVAPVATDRPATPRETEVPEPQSMPAVTEVPSPASAGLGRWPAALVTVLVVFAVWTWEPFGLFGDDGGLSAKTEECTYPPELETVCVRIESAEDADLVLSIEPESERSGWSIVPGCESIGAGTTCLVQVIPLEERPVKGTEATVLHVEDSDRGHKVDVPIAAAAVRP